MILKPLWFGCVALAMATCLTAQPAPPELEKKAGRRAWIVAAEIPKNVANPLTVLAGDKLHEVQLYARDVGDPIPVDETGAVRVVKAETGPDGKVVYKNLAVAQLAKGVRQALIVLVPDDKEGGLKFRTKTFDLAKFKTGGCLYINLVKTKIGITIGDLKTTVAPGQMEFINAVEQEDSKSLPVRYFYEIPKKPDIDESEWKLMTASRMVLYDSRREICIFFFNEEIENVDFRGISFITPKAPKK